jgi:hypothetical protein
VKISLNPGLENSLTTSHIIMTECEIYPGHEHNMSQPGISLSHVGDKCSAATNSGDGGSERDGTNGAHPRIVTTS